MLYGGGGIGKQPSAGAYERQQEKGGASVVVIAIYYISTIHVFQGSKIGCFGLSRVTKKNDIELSG